MKVFFLQGILFISSWSIGVGGRGDSVFSEVGCALKRKEILNTYKLIFYVCYESVNYGINSVGGIIKQVCFYVRIMKYTIIVMASLGDISFFDYHCIYGPL